MLKIAALLLATGLTVPVQPVVAVSNFGPNLQQAAAGVCRQPEGLAIDPSGNLYTASNSDSATTESHVCVLNPAGRLTDIIDIPASAETPDLIGLVGELWDNGRLFVLDQADDVAPHGRVLLVNPRTHAVSTFATGFAFPNCIIKDSAGNLYVSDSLQGRIYKLSPDGRTMTVWAESPQLLSNNPDQNVGANDMAFDRGQHYLYIDNTGNRQMFRIPVEQDGSAGPVELFADGPTLDSRLGLAGPVALYGADGIQFDVRGNLYVMANQADEVQVLSPAGDLIARYIGTGANALDFNASPVFEGRSLYITNMSAADGGINSKVSVMTAPYPGLLEPSS
jgi:sugar lactone lactonase YvrE